MQPLLQPPSQPTSKTHVFKERKQRLALSEIEERILRSIYDLHYLTILQIARLHYKQATPSVFNYVASLLKDLDEEHRNYIQRGYLARAVRFGRNPSVFRLATRGINHIASLGLSPLPKFRPYDPFPSFEKLKHDLCVNDFIIAARRLCAYTPGYSLAEVRHDWLLRHTPIYVRPVKKTQGKEKEAVIPDAWLDFYLPQPANAHRPPRVPVHLELDRGTEDTAASFKPKLYARLAYINGPYKEFFHTPYVTIAYATTRGNRRLERMRKWTEEVLKETKQEKDASVFFFTSLPHRINPQTGETSDELDLDPRRLFLEPIWVTPFDQTSQVLLAADPEKLQV